MYVCAVTTSRHLSYGHNTGTTIMPAAKKKTGKKFDIAEAVTDKIISKLNEGVIPWKQCWDGQAGMQLPRNFVTKRPYHGINVFLLLVEDYESPYWMTFKQAQDLGGKVKKGEKSTMIIFYQTLTVPSKDPNDPPGTMKNIPFMRYMNVFNVEQVEGEKIEERLAKLNGPVTERHLSMVESAENIISGMPNPPKFVKSKVNLPAYSPLTDTIQMPDKNRFHNENHYYATLFHEMVHSTGHESRLNRFVKQVTSKADVEYAKEELVAELGAAFLCYHAGVSNDELIDESASYINSWIQRLRNDHKLIIHAASKAQKASDYILKIKANYDNSEDEESPIIYGAAA